jgi:hypothetical protein
VQGTYTPNFASFLTQFQKAVASISLDKLGIGLETVNENEHNRPLTDKEWDERCEPSSFSSLQHWPDTPLTHTTRRRASGSR